MIKFNKHNVTANGIKARVFYSLNGRTDGRECVTVYHKDYSDNLAKIAKEVGGYKNDTDITTDYFDAGCMVIFSGHPLYGAALNAAMMARAWGL